MKSVFLGMTVRKLGSAAPFPVGFVYSGSTACLLLVFRLASLSMAVCLDGQAVSTESVTGQRFS